MQRHLNLNGGLRNRHFSFLPDCALTRPVKKACWLALVIAFGCYNFKEQSVKIIADKSPGGSSVLDSTLISNTNINCLRSLKAFYASRNFSLFWRGSEGFTRSADSLIQIIRDANRFGLIAGDYHQHEIENLLADSLPSSVSRTDVLLTDGYLTLYHHIRHGRLDPKTLERNDLSAILDQEAISSLRNLGEVSMMKNFQSLEPAAFQFRELKDALQSFLLPGKQDSVQRTRAGKIALNMERWRWQGAWPDRYVVVNIPAFQMRAVENDSVWLTSKVIVGKRETPTPVMESVIRSFVIYPYWHVPFSISTKEILPELQANRSYLQRNNFEVLNRAGKLMDADTIQWENYSADYFPFVLRQREGSENSMGIIKFNFANPYGVYLHDTNSKRLFKSVRRDFSHGCVRVNDAVAFAHYLVREDDIYVSPEDLDQYLSLQQRLAIKLRKPITLKLEYFTCEVENGIPSFHEDIYKKDSVMMHALYAPVSPQKVISERSSF